MTTPFPFQSAAVLTAAQMNAITTLVTSTKTASHTLTIADVSTRVIMNSASATTITVNTSIFGASDVVEILNIGAGVCTVTAGTCTVGTSGTLALVQNAGGTLTFISASASVFRATGTSSIAPTSRIRLHTFNGYGSSSTKIIRFSTTVVNSGSDITYADSASLGSTFTINTAGMYAIGFNMGAAASGSIFMGLSLNSTQLTSAIQDITAADRLALSILPASSGDRSTAFVSSTFYFAVNDVIRPHLRGTETPLVAAETQFSIVRVN